MPEPPKPAESAIDRIQADPRLRTRDDSGVAAIAIGTVVWAVLWVAVLVAGDAWGVEERWTQIAGAGAGLGLIGLAIVLSRRARLRRRGSASGQE